MDLGADRRGVDMGPSAIRYAGLKQRLERLGHTVVDLGDMKVPLPEESQVGNPKLKYLQAIVETCRRLGGIVDGIIERQEFPLVLGGDHAIAIGTIAGVARARPDAAVFWFDTHADFNTDQTSPSGNIHGMPLAASVGRGSAALLEARGGAPPIREERVVAIGIRELDLPEREALRSSGIRVFTMSDIDKLGMREVMRQALRHVEGAAGVHVSFDMDVMDPDIAPGVGTPHQGGITYREAHLAMEMLYEAGILRSMEIVEVNPILDIQNRTGRLAAELALSALGQRIL
jgi:arginase